ncbi:MAG TPA: universal stress protein [Chloroflexia bacterium]|nr:universal stress protein [Chloroflexia bacterium]
MSEEEHQLEKLKKEASRSKPRQISLSELESELSEPVAESSVVQHESNPTFWKPWKHGRLKVFLGAAAGIGKTYAMLEEAQQLKAQGVDVVVGYVELHGRKDTEKLLEGLEVVPLRKVEYRGTLLEEMDTAAVIARQPQLVLVDELAHTNTPGLATGKRYEDIEQILEQGIDVYSTVNVQHLESLNDWVYELTGTRVRETFPDRILSLAGEVVLIDLPPQELRDRIRQGKVYRPEKIDDALNNFFKLGNLMALRELALRETADAVESSAPHREYKALYEENPPSAHSFVLICISGRPSDARVIRQGWRFARRLNATATVVNVSRDDERKLSQEEKIAPLRRLTRALELPFQELKGDPALKVIELAKEKQATLIVLGESTRLTWRDRFSGTFTDKILRGLDGVDIYIVGDPSRRSVE